MSEKKFSIVLIDDDEYFRSYVFDLLSMRGYTVHEAHDGIEGVQYIRNNPVDIVVTDMIMPEREGIETIMEAKRLKPDIRIIAMSGAMRNETYLQLAHSLGADVTLSKPFHKQDLFDAIERIMDGR
jgi:CheY-like chemotaxis protein